MSENEQNEMEDTQEQMPDERSMLMARARMMGMTISNNIGLETLRERIREHMSKGVEQEAPSKSAGPNPLSNLETAPTDKPMTLRQKIIAENMALVRVRVTCMDPKKKDLHGEILTTGNEYLGTVRKFVPFGAATENGYHIPKCLLKMMQRRRYLHVRVVKDPRTGRERTETSWAKEFAIEILPPLTQAELQKLAVAQIAAGSIDPEIAA